MDFDMTNMCEMNSIFHKKLKGLVELSECRTGKLGVYEDEIYVSWNYFQGLQRRFYGESIDTLLIFLTKNIQDYCIFYRMILECQQKINYAANEVAANEVAANENKVDDGEKIDSLEKENSIFAENIVKGLKILQQQYENNDNRVKTIIDLMNMINLICCIF